MLPQFNLVVNIRLMIAPVFDMHFASVGVQYVIIHAVSIAWL